MFEVAVVAAALIHQLKRNEEIADRRAFYGPDAPPLTEQARRDARLPRFLRRGTTVA